MKILQLELNAFGPFTEAKLNFPTQPSELHVIYGANEAGKSTLRRALTHFFFGIPERTTDAYLHGNEHLRIGARLRHGHKELYGYRRKGRKHTLLDAHNKPLAETDLQDFLGGMNEAQFTSLFCFDHEHLRQGGENLLTGGGHVGESLFAASTGSLKLQNVLTELDKEAKDLFKAKGSQPRLNQALRTYKEACERMKTHSLSASDWSQKARALEEAQKQHYQISERLLALRAEHHRLQRIQRTRPLLQRRQELMDELATLTNVILLPDDATQRRIAAHLTLHTAQSQEQQATQAMSDLQAQLDAITIPQLLLAQKTTINSLRERLGSHLKAARDLPGVRTEMRTDESHAHTLLRRIYPHLALLEIHKVCVTDPQRESLKRLADNHPTLREKQLNIAENLEKSAQKRAQCQEMLAELPLSPDLTKLQLALIHALRQGDLEDSLAKDSKEIRSLTDRAEIGLKQLGLWSGTLVELEQATLPASEMVERFDRQFKDRENEQKRIKERGTEAQQRDSRASQKIDALCWAGKVPTEDDLNRARQIRQQNWQTLKQRATPETYQTFEGAMLRADEVVDRLRREAQRVAEQANLLAEQTAAQTEYEQQKKKWQLVNQSMQTLQREWDASWQLVKIKPWTPAEMRSWLQECLNLRQHAGILRERQQQWGIKQQLSLELRQELYQALLDLQSAQTAFEHDTKQISLFYPEKTKYSTKTEINSGTLPCLRDLIEQAQTGLNTITECQHHRENLEKQHKNLLFDCQRLESAKQQAQHALESWQTEWAQALVPLQLPVETPTETARNVLDTLDQVSYQWDKVQNLKRRIDLMERDADVFHQDVIALTRQIAADLVDGTVEQVVPELSNRLNQAEKDVTRYEQLQQRLQAEQRRQVHAREQLQTAQADLQALLQQAHCSDLDALEIAEQQSGQKKSLQRQFIDIEQQLLEQGDGFALIDLSQAAATVDIDQLPGQLQNLAEQIRVIEQERSEFDQKIGELRTLLNQMDGNDAAAQAADEAQLALADIQQLSERYLRIQLAATVLRKSIERYRERHQGPLVQRASELFERLTLGNFCGLKTDYNDNDQPVLLGLRDRHSTGIPTTGMSDGTRDQLYLALRLASLERYLEKNLPLPLILDDILINFDDNRSRATLEVLSELCQRTQILFFTHHARLVELAQTVVPNVVTQII
ncbi:MAG: hypothetical protein BWK79_00830 [Beggiatoa sp. IS2]|nr:MAG: hypothetical protein BWK79_00830 [Beggiatoa sp. IS2]